MAPCSSIANDCFHWTLNLKAMIAHHSATKGIRGGIIRCFPWSSDTKLNFCTVFRVTDGAWKPHQVTVEEKFYHKSCFKCSHGGCSITPSNYAALDGVLYCKHHFSQLFREKGSYAHIMKSASIKRGTAPVPEVVAAPVPEA